MIFALFWPPPIRCFITAPLLIKSDLAEPPLPPTIWRHIWTAPNRSMKGTPAGPCAFIKFLRAHDFLYLVWNMKHSSRSLKLNINDKSKRNCSGLSSGISGAASIWPLITIISSLVAWLALTWPSVSKSITELSKLYMQFSNSWISKCLDLINMPTFWLRLASSSLATDTFAAFSSVFFLSSFFALGFT